MDNQEIRRKILELLYEHALENSTEMSDDLLNQELDIEFNKLNFNIDYLEKEGYISVQRFLGEDYLVEIESKGINLVETPEKFDSLFPIVNITQIYNSKGVVVGSDNVEINLDESINVKDSFNEIYQEIMKHENSDEITENIKVIENELNKNEIDKSNIKNSIHWLRRNAAWTIPSLVQILTSVFF